MTSYIYFYRAVHVSHEMDRNTFLIGIFRRDLQIGSARSVWILRPLKMILTVFWILMILMKIFSILMKIFRILMMILSILMMILRILMMILMILMMILRILINIFSILMSILRILMKIFWIFMRIFRILMKIFKILMKILMWILRVSKLFMILCRFDSCPSCNDPHIQAYWFTTSSWQHPREPMAQVLVDLFHVCNSHNLLLVNLYNG